MHIDRSARTSSSEPTAPPRRAAGPRALGALPFGAALRFFAALAALAALAACSDGGSPSAVDSGVATPDLTGVEPPPVRPSGPWVWLPASSLELVQWAGQPAQEGELTALHRGALTISVRYPTAARDWLEVTARAIGEGQTAIHLATHGTFGEGVVPALVTLTAREGGEERSATLIVGLSVLSPETAIAEAPRAAFDRAFVDASHVLYLFSSGEHLLRRRSAWIDRWLPPIALDVGAKSVAYSAALDRAFVLYADGRIEQLALPSGVRSPLTTVHEPTPVHELAAAGSTLVVSLLGNTGARHLAFGADGALRSEGPSTTPLVDPAFAPGTNRLYYLDGERLEWEAVEPTTGALGPNGHSAADPDHALHRPVRTDSAGARILLGSGDLYDGRSLTPLARLAYEPADGAWLDDGTLLTLEAVGADTRLVQWSPSDALLETTNLELRRGTPLRVLSLGSAAVLVTRPDSGLLDVEVYLPTTDGDGDGVDYVNDAFPTDPAASVDSDGDGYPDSWNPGRSAADSTTGLSLDAFPNDADCHAAEEAVPGDPTRCDLGHGITPFVPAQTEIDAAGTIYYLDLGRSMIHRWSLAQDGWLRSIALDGTEGFAFALAEEDRRLYVAHRSGRIGALDLDAARPAERTFTELPEECWGIGTAGPIVFAVDTSGAWGTHYTFLHDGTRVSAIDWNYFSQEYVWSAAAGRMYFFRDGNSPNDLHYEAIDTTTGEITGAGETPYHGSYDIRYPIRPSADGARVILGSGDLYDATTLEHVSSLPSPITDAAWLADGTLVTVRADGTRTALEQWLASGGNYLLVTTEYLFGTPVRLLPSDGDVIAVLDRGGLPVLARYTPTLDGDGDGVPYPVDAFPRDPAASVDSDGDGAPDAWNPGKSQADSTTGLVLDAFPDDPACRTASDAYLNDPTRCDPGARVPSYVPDAVALGADGVLYFFDRTDQHIYRWSLATNYHESAIVLRGTDPRYMTYSDESQRLYVAYGPGEVHQIAAAAAGVGAEIPFANLSGEPYGLTTAGPFVLLGDRGSLYTHELYLPSGTRVSEASGRAPSREYVWSPALRRMFYFRDGASPNDLLYETIDESGVFGDELDSPYHGDYVIEVPIRPSPDGAFVLLGSGDLYDGTTLRVVATLPNAITDATWLDDGTLVTLRPGAASDTRLERWAHHGTDFSLVEQHTVSSPPLRVFALGAELVVVTRGTQPVVTRLPISDDADGDGVPLASDAFPLDPAASVDTDGDGAPDAWNPGYSGALSTTNLVLDAFPDDEACWRAADAVPGDPTRCDQGRNILPYVPDAVVLDAEGVVYLLNGARERVYRWSFATGAHLSALHLSGPGAEKLAFDGAHGRLYVSRRSGTITYFELPAGAGEVPFLTLAAPPYAMDVAGDYLALDDYAVWGGGHRFYAADGALVTSTAWDTTTDQFEWSPSLGRLFFFNWGVTPNDLYYEDYDGATGAVSGSGESPYHGVYAIAPPIRASSDGAYVLLGSGDVYRGTTLEVVRSLPNAVTDAAWVSPTSLLTVRPGTASDSVLEHWAVSPGDLFELVDTRTFAGAPLRVLVSGGSAVVITDQGRPTFFPYTPTDDADGDGVPAADDAFPSDPAASLDTDRDGAPDAWNPGRTAADSTTGLVLDAFPSDSACQLARHALPGQPAQCDYASGLRPYTPDRTLLGSDGVVYTFSAALRRVFRWSLATHYPLNPIVLGGPDPIDVAVDPPRGWLYVGHSTGELHRIELATGQESRFAAIVGRPLGMTMIESVLLVAAPDQLLTTHATFLPDGTRAAFGLEAYPSGELEWCPALGRLFFFRDGWFPNDLHFEDIDPATGLISAAGESPYHGQYDILPPLRPSPSGRYVLLGSGDLYDGTSLTVVHTLPVRPLDAVWLADGTLLTVRDGGGSAVLERWSAGFAQLGSQVMPGTPLRVLPAGAEVLLLTAGPLGPSYQTFAP